MGVQQVKTLAWLHVEDYSPQGVARVLLLFIQAAFCSSLLGGLLIKEPGEVEVSFFFIFIFRICGYSIYVFLFECCLDARDVLIVFCSSAALMLVLSSTVLRRVFLVLS